MPSTYRRLLHPGPRRAVAAIVVAALAAGCASTHAPTESPRAVDRGTTDITAFAPAESTVAVDVSTLSLRQVFEEIGEHGTLWYQHVQTLANPYFEGRVNGSAGTERARDYMEFYFRMYGLEPAFPRDVDMPGGADEDALGMMSYRQPFEFSARRRREVSIDAASAAIGDEPLRLDRDFVVLGNSGSATVTAPITFVGYGIGAGPDGYSSFAGDTDLSGRIALVMRYEPLTEDGRSQWAEDRFSEHSLVAPKMNAAAVRGAAGIILVNPPGCREGRTGLEPLSRSIRFGDALAIPVIQVTPAAAERLVAAADPEGRDLLALRRWADTSTAAVAPLRDDVEVSMTVTLERTEDGGGIPGANVGAVLPGRGALADEYVVIGGHYDHNGYGMFGTDPAEGELYPGADDNASGTAGMLVLAKMLTETYATLDADIELRSVLFIAFDAEERGLHGSRHFSRNPIVEPDRMNALLNMDMIGRLRSGRLSVLGTGTAQGLEDILEPHFERSGLKVSVTASGSGRSDDANFHQIGVPGLHFFTGMHAEYTTPRDHAYTVNPLGAATILDVMHAIALDLASSPDALVYADPADAGADGPGAARHPRRPGQDRGYAPVRLGVRPGMGEDLATGVLVEAVSPETSAADAGLRSGDVLLTWNDTVLDDVGAMADRLREHQPGDVVTMTVRRAGNTIVVRVTLKASEPPAER